MASPQITAQTEWYGEPFVQREFAFCPEVVSTRVRTCSTTPVLRLARPPNILLLLLLLLLLILYIIYYILLQY